MAAIPISQQGIAEVCDEHRRCATSGNTPSAIWLGPIALGAILTGLCPDRSGRFRAYLLRTARTVHKHTVEG